MSNKLYKLKKIIEIISKGIYYYFSNLINYKMSNNYKTY